MDEDVLYLGDEGVEATGDNAAMTQSLDFANLVDNKEEEGSRIID